MKILVFGLGALGTVYSCLLKKAGHEVIGIDHKSVAADIIRQGVRINGIWGEHEAHLDMVYSQVEQMQERDFDLIILSVKAYETNEVAIQLHKIMSGQTFLMLAQNGYGNFEAAARSIPQEQIILARVIFGAETLSAGSSKVTVIADDVILGSPPKSISMEFLHSLAELFSQAGIPTRASDEVMKYVWGKIIYNSALNPLGAILEVNYGRLAEMESSRCLMNGMIEEIFSVLGAIGQQSIWPDANSYMNAFYQQMIPSTAGHHASMLQDIQRGRKTEIDALNGAVVELGKKYGIPTPVNAVISSLIKAKETMFAKA
ncbi:MAG: 2-dehydropantoate 2-reductase [Syntrophomonadaceae bacterium]|nr:2-dehydropantoate 2-reductase [Syntrophomonadaceae bacterium]MDD3023730.1 2-dehydropantoate 2-reductase [Syntrophomonadaceae bacterium]